MCTDATPRSPCLAQWSCTVEATAAPRAAVARTAAWARATMDSWGLGGLADDVALIVAEFSSNAWTHGSPPVTVTLLLHDSVLTVEVSDAGAGLAVFSGPRPLGECGPGCTSSGYPPRPNPGPQPPEQPPSDSLSDHAVQVSAS